MLVSVCCSALKFSGSFRRSWSPKFRSDMSGQALSADLSGQMLDLEEDEDLEVFTKVNIQTKTIEMSTSRGCDVRGSRLPTCQLSSRIKRIYVIVT